MRAKLAEQLGLTGGLDAIPSEIRIIAVDPTEGLDADEAVQRFAPAKDVLRDHHVFINDAMTPALTPDKLAGRGLVEPSALNIVLRT